MSRSKRLQVLAALALILAALPQGNGKERKFTVPNFKKVRYHLNFDQGNFSNSISLGLEHCPETDQPGAPCEISLNPCPASSADAEVCEEVVVGRDDDGFSYSFRHNPEPSPGATPRKRDQNHLHRGCTSSPPSENCLVGGAVAAIACHHNLEHNGKNFTQGNCACATPKDIP